jgi:Domain of unknown function (DUF4193)
VLTDKSIETEDPAEEEDDDELEAVEDVEVDEELEGQGEGDDDTDDDDDDDVGDDEDEEDQASLEELLAAKASGRKAGEDADDEPDIMSLSSEPEEPPSLEDPIPLRVAPVKDQKEFVCNSCHLVKQKVQLADAERGLCRDCV